MSDKQALLKAIEALPEGTNWGELGARLLAVVARHGTAADFAKFYRAQLSAADLAEYFDPKFEVSLADVIAELEARSAPGAE